MTEIRCPFIPTERIHNFADALYKEHWSDKPLPVDVELVMERLDLSIIPMAIELNIDAFLAVNAKEVYVNQARYLDDRYICRLRFSLAHELGHFMLHREVMKDSAFTDPKTYLAFIVDMAENEHRKFEYQANEFAGRFLVPPTLLRAEVERALAKLPPGFENMQTNDPDQFRSALSPAICKPFGVSEEVIECRLIRERIL